MDPERKSLKPSWKLWALTTFTLLLAWRWPYLVGPTLNADESQMIAGAITLKSSPLYWGSVDTNTIGPLNNFALFVPIAFGLPLNYATARIMAGILVLGGWVLAGRGLMLIYPPRAVRIGLSLPILFFASISFFDFSIYTSEQVSIFLLLASIWPMLSGLTCKDLSAKSRSWRFLLSGFVLGALPYAKLQAVPPGLVVGAGFMVAIFLNFKPGGQKWKFAAILFLGAILPTVITAIYLWVFDLIFDFWKSYIENNLLYAKTGEVTWPQAMNNLVAILKIVPGLNSFVLSSGVFILAVSALFLITKRKFVERAFYLSRTGQKILPFLILFCGACIFATLAPRRPFFHYFQYIGLFAGVIVAFLSCEVGAFLARIKLQNQIVSNVVLGLLFLFLTVPALVARYGHSTPDLLGSWTQSKGERRHPVSIALALLMKPGDTLSVWGWMPLLHAETGLPQATRDGTTERQINRDSMQHYYQERYISDFRRNPPRFFVDAVGGDNFAYNAGRKSDCGHESFSELRDIVASDYSFFKEVEGVRIYIRK